MKTRYLAATAAAALLLGGLVPVSAAHAADGVISGIVSNTSGPEAYTTVGWIEAGVDGDHEETETDSSGQFSLTIPSGIGNYYIYTNLTQYTNGSADVVNKHYTGEYFGAGGGRAFVPQGLAPYTAPISGGYNITLTESGTISGVSSIYKGETLELKTLGDTYVTSDNVGSNGVFEFTGLVPGKYRIVAESVGKYAPYKTSPITVVSGVTSELSLSPSVGGTISGVVKSGSKKLKGIRVYAGSSTQYADAKTSSTGAYTIKGLKPGTYTVGFTSPGSTAKYVAKSSRKSVKANKTTKVNASLAKAGTLKGKVTLTSGATYYNVTVVNSSKKIAGYGGGDRKHKSFSVGGLKAGKYTVYVTDSANKRYAKKSITVTAGKSKSTGTVKLNKKTVTFSGSVTGAKGGVVYLDANSLPGNGASISSKGKFSVKGLIPGAYTVYTTADDTATKTTSLSLKKSTKKTLSKGKAHGKVTGTVRADGIPLDYGYGTYKVAKSSFYFEISDASFQASAPAGVATLVEANFDQTFPGLTPYWYEFPDKAKKFTLKSGKTTSLGSINLVLKGVAPLPLG